MKVGIKYCGGCKATYDRVENVKKLIKDFPRIIFEPIKENENYDIVLVVNGCKTACAGHEGLLAKEKVFLNSAGDFEKIREESLRVM